MHSSYCFVQILVTAHETFSDIVVCSGTSYLVHVSKLKSMMYQDILLTYTMKT